MVTQSIMRIPRNKIFPSIEDSHARRDRERLVLQNETLGKAEVEQARVTWLSCVVVGGGLEGSRHLGKACKVCLSPKVHKSVFLRRVGCCSGCTR